MGRNDWFSVKYLVFTESLKFFEVQEKLRIFALQFGKSGLSCKLSSALKRVVSMETRLIFY